MIFTILFLCLVLYLFILWYLVLRHETIVIKSSCFTQKFFFILYFPRYDGKMKLYFQVRTLFHFRRGGLGLVKNIPWRGIAEKTLILRYLLFLRNCKHSLTEKMGGGGNNTYSRYHVYLSGELSS